MDDAELRRDNATLRRQVDLLTQRLDALSQMGDDVTVTDENPFAFDRNHPSPEQRDRRWEIGIKVDFPDAATDSRTNLLGPGGNDVGRMAKNLSVSEFDESLVFFGWKRHSEQNS
ncbi:hypothetical protein QQ045_017228 [Rhodiola kirilowii]